jgi:hypothetical protein
VSGWILAARRWRRAASLICIVCIVVAFAGRVAHAQDNVQFRAAPGSLIIGAAVAGSDPTGVSTSSAMYRVKVANGSTKQIMASINSAMPAGTTMTISVAAPPGATSAGTVTLTTTPQTVVTNVTNSSFSADLAITYTLSATSAAGVIASANKTVTLAVTP